MSLTCESKTCYQLCSFKIFLVNLFSLDVKRALILVLPPRLEILTLYFFSCRLLNISFFNLKKLKLSLLTSEFNGFFSISFGVCFYFADGKLFIFSDFFAISYEFVFFDGLFSIPLSLNIFFLQFS